MTGLSPTATASTRPSPTRARELRKERGIVLAVICILTAVCWWYLVSAPHDHSAAQSVVLASVMWVLMMIGMMAPSAVPFITTFSVMARRRRGCVRPLPLTAVFVVAYLVVWAGFSVAAAGLQVWLHGLSLLSHMSLKLPAALGGAVLIAAGVYQWTPYKDACLRMCRSPLGFLLSEWRDGSAGAFQMGLKHGIYCLGCCWLIMLLPFAAGLMDLRWMAGITLFILVEKIFPHGEVVARAGGVALALYGSWMIAG